MKEFQQLIKKICETRNINFKLLSDDFVISLEKDHCFKYIYAYKFPLNDHGVGLLMDDKYAFYSILKNLKINTIEMIPIFTKYDPNILLDYFSKYKTLIVKSNNGTCGREVFKIETEKDLFLKLDFLLQKNAPVCLSPYYKIKNEYRVIVLNQQVKLIYGKKRPILIGNSKDTIKELLEDFNPHYYKNKNNLEKIQVDLTKVLKKDERLELDFRFNLSNGATIFSLNDKTLENKLTSLALSIANTLNIRFASIDIIETEDNQLLVLEANSGVMMDNFRKIHPNGEEISRMIYEEAIDELFRDEKKDIC